MTNPLQGRGPTPPNNYSLDESNSSTQISLQQPNHRKRGRNDDEMVAEKTDRTVLLGSPERLNKNEPTSPRKKPRQFSFPKPHTLQRLGRNLQASFEATFGPIQPTPPPTEREWKKISPRTSEERCSELPNNFDAFFAQLEATPPSQDNFADLFTPPSSSQTQKALPEFDAYFPPSSMPLNETTTTTRTSSFPDYEPVEEKNVMGPPMLRGTSQQPPPTPRKQRVVSRRTPRTLSMLPFNIEDGLEIKKQPPPTPRKASNQSRLKVGPSNTPRRPARNLYDTHLETMQSEEPKEAKPAPFTSFFYRAVNGEIEINGKRIALTPLDDGSYMRAFTFAADPTIIPSMNKETAVLKCYKVGADSFQESKCAKRMKKSLRNYHNAIEAKVPVAKIYNEATALTDRYFLQEFIPYSLDPQNENHIKQLRNIFQASLISGISFDLIPSNLRVREDGKVVLIDFIEDTRLSDKLLKQEYFISNALHAWAKVFKQTGMQKQDVAQELKLLTEGFSEIKDSVDYNSIIDECVEVLFMDPSISLIK